MVQRRATAELHYEYESRTRFRRPHSILYSTAVLGRYTTLIRRGGSAPNAAASRSIAAVAAACTVRAIGLIARSRVRATDPKGFTRASISRGMTRSPGRPPRRGALHSVYTYRSLPSHAAGAVARRQRTGWHLAPRTGAARRPPPQPQQGPSGWLRQSCVAEVETLAFAASFGHRAQSAS